MTQSNNTESSVRGRFEKGFDAEINAIKGRRKQVIYGQEEPPENLELPDFQLTDPSNELKETLSNLHRGQQDSLWREAVETQGVQPGLVGLALSGGGIRSSTFNLGVLQAIHRVGLFPYLDYLSTVSGGGYIGTYLSTLIKQRADREAGKDNQETDPDNPAKEQDKEQEQEESAGPPRDYFPFKHQSGTVESYEFRHLRNHASFLTAGGKTDIIALPLLLLRGIVINLMVIIPVLVLIAVALAVLIGPACEAQCHFRWADTLYASLFQWLPLSSFWAGVFKSIPITILLLTLLLISFGLYPLFQHNAEPASREAAAGRKQRAKVAKWLSYFAITIGVVLFFELQPLMLGLLSWEGDSNWFGALFGTGVLTSLFSDKIVMRLKGIVAKIGVAIYGIVGFLSLWFLTLFIAKNIIESKPDLIELSFIVAASLALLAYSFTLVNINFTSIHKFYRDKLVKAFVAQVAADEFDETSSPDATHFQVPKLSELNTTRSPYHLINAAVNVERAEVDYKSGRKSSFFFFGQAYCGSIRTKFFKTADLQTITRHLDVGTAMAISGAATAPNMGKFTNPLLAFILAILNVRLNYWLPNPQLLEKGKRPGKPGPAYLFREMLGLLNTNTDFINLSDGGHIENLGLYELLRRQCRLIIVGDGECDKNLTFEGLSEAIRLARIDFGFQIEMDGLDLIRSGEQQHAIGKVRYGVGTNGDERIGYILYLKSNLGGDYNLSATMDEHRYRTSPDRDDNFLFDESAYVAHYRMNNPDFPHEDTSDQFFDEAQFESYRALGYDVAASALVAPWVASTNVKE